jgi:hypothetical protein
MRKFFTLLFAIKTYNPVTRTVQNKVLKNNDMVYEAPDYCVENIMNFARSYRVADTKSAGKVELILN